MDLQEIVNRECAGKTPGDYLLCGALMTASWIVQHWSDEAILNYLNEFRTADVNVLNSPSIYATLVICDEVRRDRALPCAISLKRVG